MTQRHGTSIVALTLLGLGGPCPAELPHSVDLRPTYAELGLAPKSQGGRGCCSLFAMVGVLEYELARSTGGQPLRLSEEFLNWASHMSNGRTTDGSFFSDAIRGLRIDGICREDLMPYAAEYDADAGPSDEALTDAAHRRDVSATWIKAWDVNTGMDEEMLRSVRATLAAGHPVALGMRWPHKAEFPDGLLQVPPREGVFDGHSIVLVGYEDDEGKPGGGSFIFRNSCGPEWMDAGYARMPYSYVAAYGNDAVWLSMGEGDALCANAPKGTSRQMQDLPVLNANKCEPVVQQMHSWGSSLWSRGEQLFCPGQDGASVEFALDVDRTAPYRVHLYATRAPDYGTVRVLLDGKPLGEALDLYSPTVDPTGEIDMGEASLQAGPHTLRFEVAGKSEASSGYHFGLDAIALRPMDAP